MEALWALESGTLGLLVWGCKCRPPLFLVFLCFQTQKRVTFPRPLEDRHDLLTCCGLYSVSRNDARPLHVDAFKRWREILHAYSSSSLSNCGNPVDMTVSPHSKAGFSLGLWISQNSPANLCHTCSLSKNKPLFSTTELWEYFLLRHY